MKIAVGADHAGYALKHELVTHLVALGHDVVDLGTTNGDQSVDYPDFAHVLAQKIASGEVERGVLVCGTGVGMAIAANRHPGVRAVNTSDVFTAKMSRAHNDANVLTLGARVVGMGAAKEIVDAWLGAPFEGGRHAGRVAKIER